MRSPEGGAFEPLFAGHPASALHDADLAAAIEMLADSINHLAGAIALAQHGRLQKATVVDTIAAPFAVDA